MKSCVHLLLFYLLLELVLCISRRNHLELQTARCISRCLERSREDLEHLGDLSVANMSSDILHDRCITGHGPCEKCMKPCERRFVSMHSCMKKCEGDLECMYSCAFLADMQTSKMGYCTAPTVYEHGVRVVYWSMNSSYSIDGQSKFSREKCRHTCLNDFDCRSNQKCCKLGCSTVCRNAVSEKKWIPEKPMSTSIKIKYETVKGKQVPVLSWNFKEKDAKSHMYLVQEDSSIGRKTPGFRKKWKTVLKTAKNQIPLLHLKHGHWYRYRIASVNENGTKGFTKTEHSAVFHLDGAPSRPLPPSNVQMEQITLRSRAKYDLSLRWKVESELSDLPIVGYFAIWSQRIVTSSGDLSEKTFVGKKQVVLSKRQKFANLKLKELNMYVIYDVEISTIVHWEDMVLYSDNTTDVEVQYPLPEPSLRPENLSVFPPFVGDEEQVSANISWEFSYAEAPRNLVRFMLHLFTTKCFSGNMKSRETWSKTMTSDHVFNELQYACEYEVTVQAMYGSFRHQRSKIARIRFVTPPCGLEDIRLFTSKTKQICNNEVIESKTRCPTHLSISAVSSNFFYDSGKTVEAQWKIDEDNNIDSVFVYCTEAESGKLLRWAYVPKQHNRCLIQGLEESTNYDVLISTVWHSSGKYCTHKLFHV